MVADRVWLMILQWLVASTAWSLLLTMRSRRAGDLSSLYRIFRKSWVSWFCDCSWDCKEPQNPRSCLFWCKPHVRLPSSIPPARIFIWTTARNFFWWPDPQRRRRLSRT